ncbi:DUF2188 domain-containing protein [Microvirga lotononidis]|uniref:DUF2188 domain-containing protein n=1 Tax=Microvirga lotononidis TaxID=864069 RepID=I4Z4R6_9HYPH|nr:DUF2188 domain-containing protein [Microvirga lotononidis]EIM31208.1 hypothetical protein MicloDRAFT_00001980 [Microvirga lotononidis]WQO29947.1 DUF2188 domain-containing protein [Microvirga lotononidis]WQO30570.1 DUF2188 domain-containing protein [Microvirga lotononidis]
MGNCFIEYSVLLDKDLQENSNDKVRYEVVEHDGGWALKVGDVLSGRYAGHDEAREAAERAAAEQRLPGETEDIEYQDKARDWHEEVAQGKNRPETDVTG